MSEVMKGQRRHLLCLLVLGSVLVFVASMVVSRFIMGEREPRTPLKDLLASEALSSVVLSGQGQTIELSDSTSMRYLTSALRCASCEGHLPTHLGLLYRARMTLKADNYFDVWVHVPDHAKGLTISYMLNGRFGDPTYYWVVLPEPIPIAVLRALQQARE
jgi:hypothetical protein